MGSFGEDFRCAACGRRGHGGYIIDGLEPLVGVCTEGPRNCMDRITDDGWSPRGLVGEALGIILRPRASFDMTVQEHIASFLIG